MASDALLERERNTTARSPEFDGKQEILRSSELSEFSTGSEGTAREHWH
jgi:hypothetical protein